MKVIVTGAAGYIGRHVLEVLSKDPTLDVVGVVRPGTEINKGLIKSNIVFLDISQGVKDGEFMKLISPDDCLIHLAYRNGFNHQSDTHFKDLYWHYEVIKQSVSAGCKNINVMGTVHEIGYYKGMVTRETLCNPLTPYGIAKNALRQAAFSLLTSTDFALKWFRAFYIYGDDESSNSIFGKIYRIANSHNLKHEIDLTTGENEFDFIRVDSLAKMIVAASMQLEQTGIINTCSGEPMSLKCAIENYVNEFDLDIQLNFGKYAERKGESPCIYGDNTDICRIMSRV